MRVTTFWVVAAALVGGTIAFGRLRHLAGRPDGLVLPSRPITIVIPARNEEASIGHLLSDLTAGRPLGSRVVVVDDHSTDATAEIVAGFEFAELITAPPLPSGWCGKPWACHTGATATSEGVLLFLDSDVRVRPGALDLVVEQLNRTGGIVSVQPWHDARRPVEQFSALFNVIAVMGAGAGWPDPSGVFGPVIATSVAAYRAAGGHQSVHDEVVEDLALCRSYRAANLPVNVFGGGELISFRMYPLGVRQLIEGWTKNFASGALATPVGMLVLIVGWVTALLAISVQLVEHAIGSGTVPWWATALLYAAAVVQLGAMLRRVGNFWAATAFAFPILIAFFLAVFARSTYRTVVRRSVPWRGRDIPIGRAAHRRSAT